MTHDALTPDVHHDPDARRLHTRVEGHEAELRYSLCDGRMVIDHSGVPDAIGGRGIAGILVKAALDLARARGWRVVPACSYSAAYVQRHPEYADLIEG